MKNQNCPHYVLRARQRNCRYCDGFNKAIAEVEKIIDKHIRKEVMSTKETEEKNIYFTLIEELAKLKKEVEERCLEK